MKYYKWKAKYGELEASEVKQLKESIVVGSTWLNTMGRAQSIRGVLVLQLVQAQLAIRFFEASRGGPNPGDGD